MKTPEQMRRWEDQHPPEKRRLRKGMYILPSLFTAANIGAGYYALTQTVLGSPTEPWHFDYAALAIGVAVVADGLDGRIARMTNTTSAFGREFDSLADVITFGVAPAVLAWLWGFHQLPRSAFPGVHDRTLQIGLLATFIFLVAGASRLARFNIQVNPQPSNPGRPGRKYFVGLPIPAGAGVVASTVHLFSGEPILYLPLAPLWIVLLLVVGFLMVSTWRFYSFKDLHLRSRHPFQSLILICAFFGLLFAFHHYMLFIMAFTYMLSGVFTRVSYGLRRKPQEPAPQAYNEAPESR
ncbi:MAG TPA: phosphatidylcholine/phosphatidylserine synthase [Candidatus Angelobacter sp.]|nr:phosphatidylcholine/phosphatidylserine synthase [Candidatus Angelobacter sp.]